MADDGNAHVSRPKPARHVDSELGRDDPRVSGNSQTWQDVTIDDLRTEGAFLVSAVRRDGVTRFVAHHEPRRRTVPRSLRPRRKSRSWRSQFHVEQAADGVLSIDLRKNETIVLRRAESPPT